MDISVSDAAARLEVSESRVRQLLATGDVVGRRLGRVWLVDSDDVARLQGQQRRSGRPAGPRRAWAMIDLLSGGRAPWLSSVERSQVRSFLATLDRPDADTWRRILRGRAELRPVRAHPAAIKRLQERSDVLSTGPDEAARRGFDLADVGPVRPVFYLRISQWDEIARELALRPDLDGNMVLRHPMALWPFDGYDESPDAAVAADILHGPEPRAVKAGEGRLNDLLAELRS